MKKLWAKNEISISTFDKSSLYQLKFDLWLRNLKNQILLEKLAHKHVHWPYNITIGWFVLKLFIISVFPKFENLSYFDYLYLKNYST